MNAARFLPLIVCVAGLFCCGCGGPRPVEFLRQYDWADRGEWLKVDTHIHTKFSDGGHLPLEIASKAVEHGCDAIAITDHADRKLTAATPEYFEAIEAARRQFPRLIILAGLEWNVPPDDGQTHAVVLAPPGSDEEGLLAEFKQRFDDYERPPLSVDDRRAALEFLREAAANRRTGPLVNLEHPSRKSKELQETFDLLREARIMETPLVGFSGGPGHQWDGTGAYVAKFKLTDYWDPVVAEVGGVWDRLLGDGIDVWGAATHSDFHHVPGDYWPGEFNETWVRVPSRTAEGVLAGLKAGTFFGSHGHIVRNVDFSVDIDGLDRPARPGEVVAAPPGSNLSIAVSLEVPAATFDGKPNHLDQLELIEITGGQARVIERLTPTGSGAWTFQPRVLAREDAVYRLRGRLIDPAAPDLMFYANPIRIVSRPFDERRQSTTADHWLHWLRSTWRTMAAVSLCVLLVTAFITRFLARRRITLSPSATAPAARNASDRHLDSLARPSMELLQPDVWLLADDWRLRYRRPLIAAYLLAVAAFAVWTRLTLPIPAEIQRFDADLLATVAAPAWTTLDEDLPVIVGLVACLGLVPWCPWIGLVVCWATTYGWLRYSAAAESLMMARLPEQIAAVSLLGMLLFGRISRQRLQSVLGEPALWLFAGWQVVATWSAVLAAGRGESWTPEHHHHVGRIWVLALLAGSMLMMRWDGGKARSALICCCALLLMRKYDTPQLLGEHDIAWLAALAAVWCAGQAIGEKRAADLVAMLLLSVLFIKTVSSTANRGGMLGLVVGACVLVPFARKSYWALGGAALFAVAAIGLANQSGMAQRVQDTLQGGNSWMTVDSRLEIWQQALERADRASFVGVGPGHSPVLLTRGPEAGRRMPLHNNPLAIWAETGWLGLFCWQGFIALGLWRILIAASTTDATVRWTMAGLVAAVAAWYAAGLVLTRHEETLPLSLLLIGIFWSRDLRRRARNDDRTGTPWLPGLSRVSVLLPWLATLTVGCLIAIVRFSPWKLDPEVTFISAARELFSQPLWAPGVALLWSDGLPYLPLGLLSCIALRSSSATPVDRPLVGMTSFVLCGATVLVISFAQAWFPPHFPSLHAMAAGCVGSLCGICVWWLSSAAIGCRLERQSRVDHPGVRRLFAVACAVLVSVAIYASFLPFQFRPTGLNEAWRQLVCSLEPHAQLQRSDVALNGLITVLLAFCGMSAIGTLRSSGVTRNLLSVVMVVGGCATFSVALELAQAWFPPRNPSLSDCLAQSGGAVIGVLLWAMFGDQTQQAMFDFGAGRQFRRSWDWALQCYVLAYAAWHWLPLDVSVSPPDLLRKLVLGRLELIPFTSDVSCGVAGLLRGGLAWLAAVPVGIWAALAWRRDLTRPRTWCWSVVVGASVTLAGLAGQIVTIEGVASVTLWCWSVLGVAVGAASPLLGKRPETFHRTAERWRPPYFDSCLWLLVFAAWSVVMGGVAWYPFEIVRDDPLLSVRFRDILSLSSLTGQAVLPRGLVTVGWLALTWGAIARLLVLSSKGPFSHSRGLAAATIAWIGLESLWIELGKCVLVDHRGQLASLLACLTGAAVGAWLVQLGVELSQPVCEPHVECDPSTCA